MSIKFSDQHCTINGVDFHPIIGQAYPRFNIDGKDYDYLSIARAIAAGDLDHDAIIRHLILSDIFFITYFIRGIEVANHPFVIERSIEVQEGIDNLEKGIGPRKKIDIWARRHFKSTLLTIAGTVQYHLRHPEESTLILSYKKPAAEDFVDAIRKTWEKDIMVQCFKERLYRNPESEAPSWSLQNGVTIKRKNTTRLEPTVGSSGLVEGMETRTHYERRIYEDIETHDIAQSPEEMEKCYKAFEVSHYLGTGNEMDTASVIGTFYSHSGPLVRIRDKKNSEGEPMYHLTCIPATDNGSRIGNPIYLTQRQWTEELLGDYVDAQMLCDPTPKGDVRLNWEYVNIIEPHKVPKGFPKILIVDPAGDVTKIKVKSNSDCWAIGLFTVVPAEDEDSIPSVYLTDAYIDKLSESEAVDVVVRMYSKQYIDVLAYEQAGALPDGVIRMILDEIGRRKRRPNEKDHSYHVLRHAGRPKVGRIMSAISPKLNRGKLYISKSVPFAYRERIRQETEKFPFYHDDGLDMIAYTDDVTGEVWFKKLLSYCKKTKPQTVMELMGGNNNYPSASNVDESWT